MSRRNERAERSPEIELRDGRRGVVLSRLNSPDGAPRALVRLTTGEHVLVPLAALELRGDRTLQERAGVDRPGPTPEDEPSKRGQAELDAGEELVVPLAEEEVFLRGRLVETGRVRVAKHVERRREAVDVPRTEVEVDIERVPVGLYVDAPPEIRREGNVTIVPVVEEEVVVTKRYLIKEEVRVRQRAETSLERREVELRSERASIEQPGEREIEPALRRKSA